MLSDPAKRNAYHQNIFYPNFHYTHKKKAASPTTAKNILQAVIHLNQQIAGMDPFRFNEEWILAKLTHYFLILILKSYTGNKTLS